MRNVLILDLASTSQNYVLDAYSRSLNPVVFFPKLDLDKNSPIMIARAELKKKYECYADFYDLPDTYEETLKLAEEINPIFIVNCMDNLTDLNIRLSNDLSLPTNNNSRIEFLKRKDYMQEALKDSGVRYIKGKTVESVKEGIDFFVENNMKECVIKPPFGAGSTGLHICNNTEELEINLKKEFDNINYYGDKNSKILIQEKINGKEYIVNTMSLNGKHALMSLWMYEKKRVNQGGFVYISNENLTHIEPYSNDMIQYAFSVLDALGIKNGPVHTEIMIDQNGPVLIEVNIRVMGGAMPAAYLNKLNGHHETDVVMDCYTNPYYHDKICKRAYKAYEKGAIKFFISPKEGNCISAPVLNILKRLPSYYTANLHLDGKGEIKETIDLDTSPGMVYLAHEDSAVLHADLKLINRIEEENFDLLFETSKKLPTKPEKLTTAKNAVKEICNFGNILVCTNYDYNNLRVITTHPDGLDNIAAEYNFVVMDLEYNPDIKLDKIVETFYQLATKIVNGGTIIVPSNSYWYLPKGNHAIYTLCETLGLRINFYANKYQDFIIASKDIQIL